MELAVEGGCDVDRGFVELGDRAAGFGGLDGFGELGGIGAGDCGLEVEVAVRDCERSWVERDRAHGLELGGDHAALAEHQREGHREAAGVGGGEKLFGVRARRAFKAGLEGIRRGGENAARGG